MLSDAVFSPSPKRPEVRLRVPTSRSEAERLH
jgi:hypothetical protein